MSALRSLGDFEQHTPLTRGVLYGDPAPEILVDGSTESVALIDWGTPSWGPLVHDVACWLHCLSSGGAPSGGGDAFLDAYRGYMRLDPAEFGARHLRGSTQGARPALAVVGR